MESVSEGRRALPAPPLRPYVRYYDGYRLAGFESGIHLGMPNPNVTVVVTLDEPLDIVVSARHDQRPGRYDALAGGIATAPVHIAHRGFQHGIQLALTPIGSRALFGMPTAELGSWLVDLEELLGVDAVELRERLHEIPGWAERFALLDEVLLRQLAEFAADTTLSGAWNRLLYSGGGVRIAALAAESGWSRRHLTARFVAEYGLAPKELAKVVRFDRAHRLLGAGRGCSVAQVAAECGYYDQAHMARDWRDLIGRSPSQWLADERFTFVQAAEPAGGGWSQT